MLENGICANDVACGQINIHLRVIVSRFTMINYMHMYVHLVHNLEADSEAINHN